MNLCVLFTKLPKKSYFQIIKNTQLRFFSNCYAKKKHEMDYNIRFRENPLILKLNSEEFSSIFTEEVCKLKEIFDKYGYDIRLAGGPVRDLLMGIQPKDLDFATIATPQQMKEMFTKENIRMINSNGEKHGTVTPRINDKENFEVTTLRIDVVTDGRHAEIEFTSDWRLDANRRDLTINSMFLGFDGNVYDYFYGYEDLKERKIKFVGNAETRIQEDYLRILRYFRFFGRIATSPNDHDEENLKSIKNNASGLQRISGERIWVELKKILSGNFAGDLLKTMLELEIGKYIGLPENMNREELDRIWKNKEIFTYQPITFLASLLNNIEDVTIMNNRLKLSTYDRDLAYFIVSHRENKLCNNILLPYQKLVVFSKMKEPIVRQYVAEVLKYNNDIDVLKEFNQWVTPTFPHITVSALNKNGVTTPKYYSVVTNVLKNYWADNNFQISDEDIAREIPNILNNIDVHKSQFSRKKLKHP